ncbi:MAG: DUF2914 domain-containing protein [Candidatus Kaiserbacteria bacterium]|nr:DUF2914 domain-containing protein [Candidatus Kaiserbacteria bacterium]
MIRRYLPKSVADLVHWYERYISPLSLIAGFIADNLILLRRVDTLRSNVLLISYLFVAALGIVLIHMIETGKLRHRIFLSVAPLIPVVIQFSFGGLFSGFVSLYSRSVGFAGSWIFVLLVAGLLIGNERFTRLYVRLPFQIGIYFTTLFAFLIFFLPVVMHRIGDLMFLLSGITALVLVALLMYVLHLVVPEAEREGRMRAARAVAIVYALFNVLYFTHAIPPLPLALKDAGVYHSVTREGTDYLLSGEPTSWLESLLTYARVFHRAPGESVYVYTAIFAPTGLSTTIIHQWQHYDESAKTWLTEGVVSFPVAGGREGGYRGYSQKTTVEPGKWRVNVLTSTGDIIGRVSFTVSDATTTPVLTEFTR